MSQNPPALKEVQALNAEDRPVSPLSRLASRKEAVIIKNGAPSPLKERLLSLGFVRDTKIEILSRSLMGATLVVRLCGVYVYSLRRNEADAILVG
ncbi:MAG: ferrous iron transport protein A [Campylobacterales bacterium]|nr:ferrous iron transport protein A [Campylobacterales bacterium]